MANGVPTSDTCISFMRSASVQCVNRTPLRGNIGDGIEGAAQEREARYQPSFEGKLFATDHGVDCQCDRDNLGRKNEECENGIGDLEGRNRNPIHREAQRAIGRANKDGNEGGDAQCAHQPGDLMKLQEPEQEGNHWETSRT